MLVSSANGSVERGPTEVRAHSIQRTKATLIYRRTGNLRAVQLLRGHQKIESTVRYLERRGERRPGDRRKDRGLKYLGRAAVLCPPVAMGKRYQEETSPLGRDLWSAGVEMPKRCSLTSCVACPCAASTIALSTRYPASFTTIARPRSLAVHIGVRGGINEKAASHRYVHGHAGKPRRGAADP